MTNEIKFSVSLVNKANIDAVNKTAKSWAGTDHDREIKRRPVYLEIGRLTVATLQALDMKNWSDKAVKNAVSEGKIDANAGRLLETVKDTVYRNTMRSDCVWLVMNPELVEAYEKFAAEKKRKFSSLGSFKTSAKRWEKDNQRKERSRGGREETGDSEEAETEEAETKAETKSGKQAVSINDLPKMGRSQVVELWTELLLLANQNGWDMVDLQNDAWEASGLEA
tara:strand:+ start:428 stop:1099 length:672 start_codon:yes stop_codon:yes gene_type:complete